MRIIELFEEVKTWDEIEQLGVQELYNYANTLSKEQLEDIISTFGDEFNMKFIPFRAALDNIKKKKYEKAPHEYIEIDPDKIFYRGTAKEEHGVQSSGVGYQGMKNSVFVTDNPYQAATYAGPDGVILKVKLHPRKAYMFKQPYSSSVEAGNKEPHHSTTEYHNQRIRRGHASVITNIVDNGYYYKGIVGDKHLKPAMNVAFQDSSIATVVGSEPASKYFEED